MPLNGIISNPLITMSSSSTQPNLNLINMPQMHPRPTYDNFINTSTSAQSTKRY